MINVLKALARCAAVSVFGLLFIARPVNAAPIVLDFEGVNATYPSGFASSRTSTMGAPVVLVPPVLM
jgi:hypothetical protein